MNRETATPVEEVAEELAPQRRFRPYPEYRDSGVEWLAEVPTHWRIRKLKYVASLRFSNVDKKSHDDEPPVRLCNYTDVYYNEHITAAVAFMDATASTDEIERFSLRRGDVLITKDSEDPNDIAVPACVVDDLEGVLCGYHLAQVRPHPSTAHGPYLARAFAASGIRDQFNCRATGITRHGLSKDTIGSSLFFVPPLDEQRAIAAFLDRETARIDELIAKKQRLIELLAEKRTALISHAVTKGLNPDAPMKDSGIEWLGSTPEHWSMRRMASFATKLTNGFVGPTRDILVQSGLPYIQSLHIKKNSVVFDGKYFVADEWLKTHEKARLATDDVLVVQTGDIGQVACVPPEFDGAGCHALIIIRLAPTVMRGPFLSLLLNSDYGYHSLKKIQTGALHPHLNCTFVREVFVPVPPLCEQDEILSRIAEDLGSLSKLRERISHAIDKLREYRSALISAAVTGKIDVREVQM